MIALRAMAGADPHPDAVAAFWDREASRYNRSSRRGDTHHQRTADRLEAQLRGKILCVGGLWAAVDPARVQGRVTVGDLSTRMLAHFAATGVAGVRADARRLPLVTGSFDHVVLPLILHHLTGRRGDSARRLAREAMDEAVRVLRPGGRIWIKEIVVAPPVYLVERLASPATRWILERAGIPLVVFHTTAFFRRSLLDAGCRDVDVWASGAVGERWYDVIAPVIGLPWLKVPRFLVPVRYVLISASAGADDVRPLTPRRRSTAPPAPTARG